MCSSELMRMLHSAKSVKELLEAYIDPSGEWKIPPLPRKRRQVPPYSSTHKGWRKILVLGDIHTGFHDAQAIRKALADNADADFGIVVGDFFELYAYSRFTKTTYLPLRDELRYGIEVLHTMHEVIPHWKFVSGNHEERLRKFIARHLPDSLLFLVETDPLKLLAHIYPIEICTWMVDGVELQTVAQVGDVVFTHLQCHSKLLMRPVELAYAWVVKWGQRLGIDPSWRVICQAHTHIAAKAVCGDKLLIQLPALAHVIEYMVKEKMSINFGPPVKGYAVLYQRQTRTKEGAVRWETDFNMSDIVLIP